MNRREMVHELSVRSGVAEREAADVLDALLELVRQGHVSEDILLSPQAAKAAEAFATPAAADAPIVEELIARARLHPLGVAFLREGFLASVAAEFGAHALTVEAARIRLKRDPSDKGNA